MDDWLLNFIKENIVTLSLVFAVLKVIAKETPTAVDNKILQIFTGFLNRKKK
ncbi:hypothetical protein H8E88_02540 [candidate division KSB1 bacterium]|nr:hypothetical protein [candidate division KSB1 bacterium]